MWCILCCQHQTREDNKCPEREITRPLESHKPDSSELVALISSTNGVHMDAFNELTTVDNSLVTGRSVLDDDRDRATIKTNLGTNHTSTLEKTKLDPVLSDTVELIKPARTSVTAATTTMVTTSAAITTVTTNSNPAPLSTDAENPMSSKRSHRAHRTEGMSVSFSTPDEREMRDRSISHPSATGRPIWTLKDVFDSPYTYGPITNGKPDELILSLSQPKTIHEETKSTNSTENTHCENYKPPECNSDMRLTRRHTRPGSLYHPHSTFFLPRISTDPSTGHNTLDHAYMANGKPFPIRRGSMIVRSGRTTSSSSNVQSSAIEQSSVGAPAMGVEGFIVTPFAQVLVSMQRIRCAFIRLTATQSSNR
ncbi:Phosphodiesterase [Fasciola gigantica]|uniref:Phosphodiesterase n=1 Tax=Fasciola gigantica TaxID=46835 RepID=A0A504YC59_FASGI|nr:Phosphodiesterase [Fasciola gigantica]